MWANPNTSKCMKEYRDKMLQEVENMKRSGMEDHEHVDFWTRDLCAELQNRKQIWNINKELAFILATMESSYLTSDSSSSR